MHATANRSRRWHGILWSPCQKALVSAEIPGHRTRNLPKKRPQTMTMSIETSKWELPANHFQDDLQDFRRSSHAQPAHSCTTIVQNMFLEAVKTLNQQALFQSFGGLKHMEKQHELPVGLKHDKSHKHGSLSHPRCCPSRLETASTWQ